MSPKPSLPQGSPVLLWVYRTLVTASVICLFCLQIFRSDKIAYVDSARIMNGFKGSEQAKGEYQKKERVWQSNIDTLTAGIQKAIRKHEKDLATMSKKEQDLSRQLIANQQKQLTDYQRAVQQNAGQENARLMQGVVTQINAFLAKYGKEHRYKMILIANQSGTIAYAREGLDITDEVLAEMNKP